MSIEHKPVDAIKHKHEERKMIPTSELAGEEQGTIVHSSGRATYEMFRHEFDRGRDPELYWLGKYSNDDSSEVQIDTRSLYVHEDIQPEMLIRRLYRLREERADNLPGTERSVYVTVGGKYGERFGFQ